MEVIDDLRTQEGQPGASRAKLTSGTMAWEVPQSALQVDFSHALAFTASHMMISGF